MNSAPKKFDPARDLPAGFRGFYAPLHKAFAARRDTLISVRRERLAAAHAGRLPDHLPPSDATTSNWRIEVPEWCADQRNQMTGPADDADLVVKMLNSGAPGVMLDLEDSMANDWDALERGIGNIHAALRGTLTYEDRKRGGTVAIRPSSTVLLSRVRGLHLGQRGVVADTVTPASLYDLARIVHGVDPGTLKHPLTFYIPKSESAEEALWWADVFADLSAARGWPADAIRCMALIESHPLAYEMEEFLFHLRQHIVGLNLGRWDYMASLIDFTRSDPAWVLPDRNTIPHDVPFFQRLRFLLVDICHRRGALAIGGMTALFPSREDPELNTRALEGLEKDKRNEASCFMDGAWTGHPDQNEIAVAQFPAPNQLERRPQGVERYPDLRPSPEGVGRHTIDGTRAAVRTAIRYRNGVLNGRGASLLDGYMEDLATDRTYRLMIAQRIAHHDRVPVAGDAGRPVTHDAALVTGLFDEALERLLAERAEGREQGTEATLTRARKISEEIITTGRFDPE
jgi:malate synthase